MSFISQSHKVLCVALIGLVVVAWCMPGHAAMPEVVLTLPDTNVGIGSSSAWISVYFQNFQDTLAGFSMRIVLDRPDIAEFMTDVEDTLVDTVWWHCTVWNGCLCTDSIPLDPPHYDSLFINGGIDTTGSLISNWEKIEVNSINPDRHDIKVIGLAEGDHACPYNTGVVPQTGPGLLFRMNLRIYDTLPDDDSTVTLYLIENLSETNFSDPYGELIGTITNYNICDTCYCETWDYVGDSCLTGCPGDSSVPYDSVVIDTFYRYWICKEWGQDSLGLDSCLNWGNYSHPDSAVNADSISIDAYPWTVWNEETAFLDSDGGHLNLVVITCICGDANTDGEVNVGDPVFLISWIFRDGPDPLYLECCDANGDGQPNIGDVVFLISYIFKDGADPNCGF
jgi:hypothetical protein